MFLNDAIYFKHHGFPNHFLFERSRSAFLHTTYINAWEISRHIHQSFKISSKLSNLYCNRGFQKTFSSSKPQSSPKGQSILQMPHTNWGFLVYFTPWQLMLFAPSWVRLDTSYIYGFYCIILKRRHLCLAAYSYCNCVWMRCLKFCNIRRALICSQAHLRIK